MWRDFFGPEARIIGIDLNPSAKKWEEHGFEIFIGSQEDEVFWRDFVRAVGPVDILLDDGGHTYLQQAVTVALMLPEIKDGGILMVEDVHTSFMKGFGRKKFSFFNYSLQIVRQINQRFSAFSGASGPPNVWSVEFYESFVIFHANRVNTELVSFPTDNGGAHDLAHDFRHSGHSVSEMFGYSLVSAFLRNSQVGEKIIQAFSFWLEGNSGKRKRLKNIFRA